jgi:hypothetical protein
MNILLALQPHPFASSEVEMQMALRSRVSTTLDTNGMA